MTHKAKIYLLKSLPELSLWAVLYFCFKHDYKREDFVFIPIQATWVMAIIFGLSLIRITTQFLLKNKK